MPKHRSLTVGLGAGKAKEVRPARSPRRWSGSCPRRIDEVGRQYAHARIGQEGFTGSANAVYHYLTQYAQEHAIPYGRRRPILPYESQADAVPPRPEPIAMERVSTTTIYRRLLHLSAPRRDAMAAASSGESASSDSPEPSERTPVPESTAAPAPEPWVNHTTTARVPSVASLSVTTPSPRSHGQGIMVTTRRHRQPPKPLLNQDSRILERRRRHHGTGLLISASQVRILPGTPSQNPFTASDCGFFIFLPHKSSPRPHGCSTVRETR